MITTLLILIIVYGLPKFYSFLVKKENAPIFKLDDYASVNSSGFQRLFYPLATGIAFIGNLIASCVWFIGELMHWIIEGLKWFYAEVIIAFIWLLLKIIWNYIIIWPWRILMIGIKEFVPSIKFNLFLIAALGIFITFCVNHFGTLLFNNTYLIQHIVPYISIIPMGLACARIIQSLKSSERVNWFSVSYLKQSLFLIVILGLIYFLEIRLITLGTYGSLSSLLSSVFAGTALFSSSLLTFNAILCLFILNVLPSFSLENSNISYRQLGNKFGLHLLKNGLMYLFALPIILLLFILITYVPYKITHSLALPAKHMTDKAIENKISSLKADKKISDSTLKLSEKNLANIKLISADSLNKIFKYEIENHKSEIQIQNAIHLKEELHAFYSNFEDSLGAMPLGILVKLMNRSAVYLEIQKKKIPKLIPVDLDTALYNRGITAQKNSVDENLKSIQEADSALKYLKDELGWLNCKQPQAASLTISDSTKKSITPIVNSELCYTDSCNCLTTKASLRNQIKLKNSERDSLILQKTRNLAISSHLVSLKNMQIKALKNGQTATSIGGTILMLWYFIILAITFAFGLVLFARVNHALYLLTNIDTPLYLISQYKEVNKNNSNQPFLGMVVFGITFIYLSATVTTWYLNPKQITKRIWNEIKSIKSEIVQSHYLNPTHWNKTWGINYWSEFKSATSTPFQNNNVVEKTKKIENPRDTLHNATADGMPQVNPNGDMNNMSEAAEPSSEYNQIAPVVEDVEEIEAPTEETGMP